MTLVPKFSAAEDLVEFQRVEGGTIFAGCFCVGWTNWWKVVDIRVEFGEHCR